MSSKVHKLLQSFWMLFLAQVAVQAANTNYRPWLQNWLRANRK